MWILFIVLILFFIFQFLFNKNQVSKTIEKQGGMRNKYRRIVELILASHSSARIIQEGSDYLTIRASNSSGYTEMQLIQNLHNLVIKWKTESNVFGLHNMKWEFYEFDDQEKMMTRINNDTTNYLQNVMTSFQRYIPDTLDESEMEKEDANSLKISGISKAGVGDYPGAIKDFTRALNLEPKDSYIYFLRGSARIQTNDFKKAIDDFTEVILRDQDNTMAYYNRGIAYLSLGENVEAFFDLTKAGEMGYSDGFEVAKKTLPAFKRIISDSVVINTMSPSFLGRRQYASGGEYINLRDGNNCTAISLAKGTPKNATSFEIKKLQVSADSKVNGKAFNAGDIIFKAFAVIEEEE